MSHQFRRKRYCRFTAEGIKEIDYKDLNILKTMLLRQERLSQAVYLGLRHVTNANYQLPLKERGIWH